MKLIANTGNDRVLDELQKTLPDASQFDVASPEFSLFAFSSTRDLLQKLAQCRLVLPISSNGDIRVLGSDCDRAFRNQLRNRALARDCARWLKEKVQLRFVPNSLPQSMLIARNAVSGESKVVSGRTSGLSGIKEKSKTLKSFTLDPIYPA